MGLGPLLNGLLLYHDSGILPHPEQFFNVGGFLGFAIFSDHSRLAYRFLAGNG